MKKVEDGDVLDSESIEYLKLRGWYEKNSSIRICKKELIDGTNSINERMVLVEKLIHLKEKQIQLGQTQYEKDILYIADINIFLRMCDNKFR